MVDRRNMSVEDLIRLQLRSEEELTDQRSSHFKLCKSRKFHSLPFGTVMTIVLLFFNLNPVWEFYWNLAFVNFIT